MTYIEFCKLDREQRKKTDVWSVWSRDRSALLGTVKWFSHWRKYCFMPVTATIFEEVCLRDIAAFVESRTLEHKAGLGHRQVR